jgi:flagellar motor protein MotB
MEELNSPDHLNSSLTDLMTSLMVIFILLLLVFVQRTGAKDPAAASRLLEELQRQLKPGALGSPEIDKDKKEPNKILIVAPERLMSFESGRSNLSIKGKDFLQEKLPAIAGTLYDQRFRDDIDSVVVEGHSDLQVFRGLPPDESRNRNLELSQQRAMEVVKTALNDLKTTPPQEQAWFIGKLSASGRGQQDCQSADAQDECRKVLFVIRVRAVDAKAIEAKLK